MSCIIVISTSYSAVVPDWGINLGLTKYYVADDLLYAMNYCGRLRVSSSFSKVETGEHVHFMKWPLAILNRHMEGKRDGRV